MNFCQTDAADALRQIEPDLSAGGRTWRVPMFWAVSLVQVPVLQALPALRGVQHIAAITVVAALQDFLRFESPPQLIMACVTHVPEEHSSGPKRRQGNITTACDSAVRRMLVEAAWH